MPADYTIDPERGVVFSRGIGIFTPTDFTAHMAQLEKEKLFQPRFNHLVDCRSITLMKLAAGEIADLAKRSLFDANSKRAFVASNSVQFGLSRMFGTYRKIHGGQEVRVFTEWREGLAWLGLPDDLDPYRKEASCAVKSD